MPPAGADGSLGGVRPRPRRGLMSRLPRRRFRNSGGVRRRPSLGERGAAGSTEASLAAGWSTASWTESRSLGHRLSHPPVTWRSFASTESVATLHIMACRRHIRRCVSSSTGIAYLSKLHDPGNASRRLRPRRGGYRASGLRWFCIAGLCWVTRVEVKRTDLDCVQLGSTVDARGSVASTRGDEGCNIVHRMCPQ